MGTVGLGSGGGGVVGFCTAGWLLLVYQRTLLRSMKSCREGVSVVVHAESRTHGDSILAFLVVLICDTSRGLRLENTGMTGGEESTGFQVLGDVVAQRQRQTSEERTMEDGRWKTEEGGRSSVAAAIAKPSGFAIVGSERTRQQRAGRRDRRGGGNMDGCGGGNKGGQWVWDPAL